MKRFLLILPLLLVQLCLGATIQGNVYDFSLEPVEAVVEINTTPKQTMVAKESYSFELPPGNYMLTAKQLQGDYVASEVNKEVLVKEEGEFVIDLILFPEVDVEGLELELGIEPEEFEYEEAGKKWTWPLLILALIAGLIIFWSRTDWKQGKSLVKQGLDDDASKILSFIRERKRVTQKEVRKEFPLSEAKISLIIAELEEKGLVKKIRKGRSNVIIRN